MILQSGLFNSTVEERRAVLMAAWLDSDEADHEGRERIYRMLRSYDVVIMDLKEHLETGHLAQTELDFKKKIDYNPK